MDGIKRKLRHSLKVRLFLGLFLCLITMTLVLGSFSLHMAFQEASRIQDDQLQQSAILASQYEIEFNAQDWRDIRSGLSEKAALIGIQVLGKETPGPQRTHGQLSRLPTTVLPRIPADSEEGFHTIQEKHEWRVFVLLLDNGDKVAASQRTSYRNTIAWNNARRTIYSLLLLIPVLSAMVFWVVHRSLKPVIRLANEVDHKTQHDLTPLDTDAIPEEIRSLALSINQYLARIQQVIEMQKRFIADAAHELRSPLTALSLQLQGIDQSTLPDDARERITMMHTGMERTVNLLRQLLNLARSQSPEQPNASVFTTRDVIQSVLEELMPMSRKKEIDIGFVGDANPQLFASETDFYIVSRNLIDNAVKYTPDGGQIDISLNEEMHFVYLTVEDSGSGIPEDKYDRVFDAFYRAEYHNVTGSGLGLAIVKSVLERMNGTIQLGTSRHGNGLRVTVRFLRQA